MAPMLITIEILQWGFELWNETVGLAAYPLLDSNKIQSNKLE